MKNCPCCGVELAKGAIYSPHRIRWTTTDRDFAGILNEADGEFLLKRGKSFWEGLYDGFMSSAGSFLTEAEKEMLPFSAKLITLEIGTRFLTDYLMGDVYFKTRRPNQNLDRSRTQFKLVESIEAQMNKMQALL